MDPDLFITIAFVSVVFLAALVAGLFARAERRRGKAADASTPEIGISPHGRTNQRRATFEPQSAGIRRTSGGHR